MSADYVSRGGAPGGRLHGAAIFAGLFLASLGLGCACLVVAGARGAEAGAPRAVERASPAPGNAARGRTIFERGNGQCLACSTCHYADRAAVKIGPPLDGIGLRPAEELRESVLDPSVRIVPGFQTVHLSHEGSTVSGMLKSDDGRCLVLVREDGVLVTISRDSIARDASGAPKIELDARSPMPADYRRLLTAQELSDLLAFLATLKGGAHEARASASAPATHAGTPDGASSSTLATLAISGMI